MTLLAAGHETTATALAFAFDLLLHHPQELARLQEEVEAGESDEYLEAVIKETLRLRPVLPGVVRKLTRPIDLNGYQIPAGTRLAPNIYLTHRLPGVYPEPERFRPERFIETPAGTYTWIPFGGGIRRCLGASFALFEMKVVIPAVLSRVSLRAEAEGTEPIRRRAITFAPQRGAMVVVEGFKERPTGRTGREALAV
jgi:cytochrome P450